MTNGAAGQQAGWKSTSSCLWRHTHLNLWQRKRVCSPHPQQAQIITASGPTCDCIYDSSGCRCKQTWMLTRLHTIPACNIYFFTHHLPLMILLSLLRFQCHTASISQCSRLALTLHLAHTLFRSLSPTLSLYSSCSSSFESSILPPRLLPPSLLWCSYTYIFSPFSASCFFSSRPPTCKSHPTNANLSPCRRRPLVETEFTQHW